MINQIQISNFKCLKENVINFKKLTVFAGSNSVGKSSVIQSILLARITLEKLIQYSIIDFKPFEPHKLKIPLNKNYLLNLGNTLEVLSRDSDSNLIKFKLIDKNEDASLELVMKAEDNEPDYYNLELLDNHVKGEFNNLKNEFYYLNAERIGPRLIYEVDQQDFIHVGHQGEYTIQILAQNKEFPIEEFELRGFQGTSDSKLISQVKSWMNFIIPGFYIDEVVLNGKLKKAHTTFSNSSPTNVGFGISYVLPIIVNGLVAKNNSIFIIENPEAHLHPKGQSNIGYFLGQLASSGVQVIIETHSEHVINGIKKASLSFEKLPTNSVLINFFSKIEDKKSVVNEINLKETSDLSNFPLNFFDQVQQDIAEIYRIRKGANNG